MLSSRFVRIFLTILAHVFWRYTAFARQSSIFPAFIRTAIRYLCHAYIQLFCTVFFFILFPLLVQAHLFETTNTIDFFFQHRTRSSFVHKSKYECALYTMHRAPCNVHGFSLSFWTDSNFSLASHLYDKLFSNLNPQKSNIQRKGKQKKIMEWMLSVGTGGRSEGGWKKAFLKFCLYGNSNEKWPSA